VSAVVADPVRSSTDPTAADLWRAAKGPIAVLLVVLLGGLVLALATGGEPGRRLDPRSPAPSGSRAVAELLRDQGVTVDLVTTSAAMVGTTRPGDTLLVVDPDLLVDSQVELVRSSGADLVLLAPAAPDRYLPGVEAAATAPGVRTPGCALPVARRAGATDAGAMAFDVAGADLVDPQLCYSRDGQPSLVQAGVEGRPVTLLGAASPLTNGRLDDEGNAALALGLLGARPRLVWYLPSTTDIPASAQQSFYDLVPVGVWWALVEVAIAVLLLALWRARRLGPVVVEPLPVVVRAAETVEGRSRLYRRVAPPAVVAAVATRAGRSGPDVAALLYGAAPADDGALVRLADDLDALEREVRRP
jgi:hypothetical protein